MPRPRPLARGRPAVARVSLQGAIARRAPAANPTASRGNDTDRRGGRPLAGQLPTGKGNRCLRRGSGDGNAHGARGKIGFPFIKRIILSL
ncbi:hypothetical protein BHM03_00050006 [Ensete ventricosum]|nr:hypothetical protein BHM03_00050006 [Ensete ventricosum]